MAICTGCNRSDKECGEYGEDNPVKEDGTYHDNKFVCTDCYSKLIYRELDVGSPMQIQQRAKNILNRI